MRWTRFLSYPFRNVSFFNNALKKKPKQRTEATDAANDFYDANEASFKRRGIVDVKIKGGLHNDPRNPDPLGDHWTGELLDKHGNVITKRHIYPK